MILQCPPPRRLPLIAGLTICSAFTAAAQTKFLDPIAEVGTPADGFPTNYNAINGAYLSTSGLAMAQGSTAIGPGVTSSTDSGLWNGTPGALTLLAREGSATPGVARTFSNLSPLVGLSDLGRGVFKATTLPATSSGFWSGVGGGLNYVAATGQAAPSATTYTSTAGTFGNITSNDSGNFAYQAAITGASTPVVYLVTGSPPFTPSLIARNTVAVPGVAGATFGASPLGSFMVLNNLGYLAMHAAYSGAAFPSPTKNGGLLLRDPGTGNYSILVNKGDAAPGAGAGATYGGFLGLALNDSNDLLFAPTLANLAGVVTPGVNDTGVWYKPSGGSVAKYAQKADAAVGTAAGVTYGTFEELYLANGSAARAFTVTLQGVGVTGANDRAMYADYGSGLQLIAREGFTVLTGATPASSGTIVQIISASMNYDGEVLIYASVSGGTQGVWRRGPLTGDTFEDVLSVGESVFVNNVTRSVTTVAFSKTFSFDIGQGNQPMGRLRPFNNNDEVALLVQHSGGSGAFIPRPAADQLTAIAVGEMETHGLPGGRYDTIRPGAVINDDDLVAFRAYMRKNFGPVGPVNYHGMWAQNSAGVVTLHARNGVTSPTTGFPPGVSASAMYEALDLNPAWSNSERASFNGPLLVGTGGVTTADKWGLWGGTPGANALIARANSTTFPQMPAGAQLFLFNGYVQTNDNDSLVDRVVFRTGVGGVTAATDSAIARFAPAGDIIVREGEAIPGHPGDVLDELTAPLFGFLWHNDSGSTAFKARKRSLAPFTEGVFIHDGSTLSTYAYGGDAVPGFPGLTYGAPGAPVMSDSYPGAVGVIALPVNSGATFPIVAFKSTLTGAVNAGIDDQAILMGHTDASPTIAVRTGVPQSAGTYGPVGGAGGDVFSFLGIPQVSQDGHLIFRAEVNSATPGVWRVLNGTLGQVSRAGDFSPDSAGLPTANTFVDYGALSVINLPTIGVLGRLCFVATITGPGITTANDNGLYIVDSTNTMRLVVQEGDILTVPRAPAPPTRNVTVSRIFCGSWNASLPDQQRQIGTAKMVLSLEFTDGTSGVFTRSLP